MQKLTKTIALAVYYVFAQHFPTQPMPGYQLGYALRRLLMKYILDECGCGIVVKQHCKIGSATGLKVGDRSQLGDNARIGQHVKLGCDVVMGPDVIIMANAHAFEDPSTPINKQGAQPINPVTVGDDVWLGTRAIILPGVTIGKGAIVAAGAIVTRDIPAFAIAGGNPARIIRYRGEKR